MNRISKRIRMPQLPGLIPMVGLAAFVVAVGCCSPVSARPVGERISLSSVYWIFYKEDFNHLDAKAPDLFRQIVAGPGTYVLEHRIGGPPLPPEVIPTEIFFSSAGLRTAIDHGRVIPGVKVVADDLESKGNTPALERRNPIRAMKGFAHSAHVHGYRPILVPGRDLMQVPQAVCAKRRGNTISQAYLRCGLPAAAAYAPIYVIQAAPVETHLGALRQLVKEGAAEARKANPHVIVFATLSVSPNGAYVSYTKAVRAAVAIRPYIQGFAVNDVRSADPRMIDFLLALSR
jgi:hypothetical protein